MPSERAVINIVSAALMTALQALTDYQHTLHAGEVLRLQQGDFEELVVKILLKSLFNTLSVLYIHVCSAFMSIVMISQAFFE